MITALPHLRNAEAAEISLYTVLRGRGLTVEPIGDATAPQGTYGATVESHRRAVKLGAKVPLSVTPG
jgi:hypothetical protein